jgi:hypothetical protein
MNAFSVATLVFAVAGMLKAETRTSASYGVRAEGISAGGAGAMSISYSHEGSVGGVVGQSATHTAARTAKNGYLGQLYEVMSLQLSAAPLTVNETGTRQLAASATLDDGTTLSSLAASVNWSVSSGPLVAVSSGGVVTAGIVYADTAAQVQGAYLGQSAVLDLTVLDTIPDNFGNYAGDGLPDGWQVQYLGVNGTSGGPALDPDFDGIPNALEYALNLDPALTSSLPATFSPSGGGWQYVYTRSKAAVTGGMQFQVEWSETLLAAGWSGSGVTEEILSDNGTVQQVKATIPAGSLGRRFARLRVW